MLHCINNLRDEGKATTEDLLLGLVCDVQHGKWKASEEETESEATPENFLEKTMTNSLKIIFLSKLLGVDLDNADAGKPREMGKSLKMVTHFQEQINRQAASPSDETQGLREKLISMLTQELQAFVKATKSQDRGRFPKRVEDLTEFMASLKQTLQKVLDFHQVVDVSRAHRAGPFM